MVVANFIGHPNHIDNVLVENGSLPVSIAQLYYHYHGNHWSSRHKCRSDEGKFRKSAVRWSKRLPKKHLRLAQRKAVSKVVLAFDRMTSDEVHARVAMNGQPLQELVDTIDKSSGEGLSDKQNNYADFLKN